MNSINAQTKILGLLGYPLAHTMSPAMHNGAFQSLGINNIYIPIEVEPEDLETVVKGLVKMNFGGCNVTKPHKVNILKYLDEVDKLAKTIGAVNTVVYKDGKLIGYNTDGTGFARSFEEEINMSIEGKTLFVIGSGGAARSICVALAYKGAQKIYLCNRTKEKAELLSKEINEKVRDCVIAVSMDYDDMKIALSDVDIVVNTTSVGMHPYVDGTPIDNSLLNRNMIVCDIVYNPLKTRLLVEAEQLGCRILTGVSMLVYQGAEAFQLWTGKEPPVDVMFDIVEESLT